MYNRRSFIIALSLSILSVGQSCSHDEQPPVAPEDDEIKFAVDGWTPLTTASRAVLFDKESDFTDPREGGGNFTLNTYVAGKNYTYIRNARVWCRNAPSDWIFLSGNGDVIKYYWPASDALNFFAYMPDKAYNGTEGNYHSANTYVTIGNYTDTDGQDFSCGLPSTVTIAADAAAGVVRDSEVQEFICAYATGLTRETGTVHLRFVHPFAIVEYQMKTAPVGLRINSISIDGIYLSGTCHIKSSTAGGNLSGISWTAGSGPTTTFKVIIDKIIPNHVDLNLNVPVGGPHVVMPQGLQNAKFIINYTTPQGITGDKTAYVVQHNGTGDADAAVTNWEPGKKYTYAFDFGGNDEDVLVEVSVNEWIEHKEQNIDVE